MDTIEIPMVANYENTNSAHAMILQFVNPSKLQKLDRLYKQLLFGYE